jgi:hypothetical protein
LFEPIARILNKETSSSNNKKGALPPVPVFTTGNFARKSTIDLDPE